MKNKSITIADDEQMRLASKVKVGATVQDLEDLAELDLDRAERLLSFREKLRKEKALEQDRLQAVTFQTTMLKEVERQEAEREAVIEQCAHRGHSREDGQSAIAGQMDSRHELNAVCMRCQAIFVGVGDGEGQLPPVYANMLDRNLIGG